MNWLDVLALTVLALFWFYVAGPAVFSGDGTKYTDAVIFTVGITAFCIVSIVVLAAVVAVLAAVVWAWHQLTS